MWGGGVGAGGDGDGSGGNPSNALLPLHRSPPAVRVGQGTLAYKENSWVVFCIDLHIRSHLMAELAATYRSFNAYFSY